MIFRYFKMVFLMILLILSLSMLSGCYFLTGVNSNEMGLILGDGVKVQQVVGPGRYSNGGFFARLQTIDCSAKTITWADPDLWTKDKQPVNFKVTVTYSRMRDGEAVKQMWNNYNYETRNDEALANLVETRIPRVAKQVTTMFTLDQMLGIADEGGVPTDANGREVLQENLAQLLSKELKEFSVQLLDVGVNDIGADQEYKAQLTQKATSKVAAEVAKQKTLQLEEQLKQEQAQTNIDLEKARRENLVQAEKNKVYTLNPRAFELERLKIISGAIGDKDKIWIVDKNKDIDLFLNSSGLPIVPKN